MYVQRYEKVPIIGNFFSFLSHTTHSNVIKIMLRKLLTPNIQRIETIQDANITLPNEVRLTREILILLK